jgi:pilus assembly protein CpaC
MMMRVGSKVVATGLVLFASAAMAVGQSSNPPASQESTQQNPPPTGDPTAPTGNVPAPAGNVTTPDAAGQNENASPSQTQVPGEMQGSAPVRVMVGKSVLINTTSRLRRVSVTDPAVADVSVVTPTQILVHGRSPGEVSLMIWDEAERSRNFDLRVDVDVTAAAEEEHRVFPDERIEVTPSRNAIVLSGHVSTEDVAKRAQDLAAAFSSRVVNVLTFGPVGAQEILLEVKFAEVDRSATIQLGANFFSNGAANTVGTTTTGEFGGFSVSGTGSGGSSSKSNITFNDALNVFLFRPDLNLGVVIKALQQKNLLQILAEPNLIAVNGKEASFLSGGEFPFPVVQPGAGFTAVTIQFKEFGVRLKFTPVITPNGNIHLHVVPEVSTLDFTNGLTISGFQIPALSTRRADTEFEIKDGQSFVIAGLLDNRVTSLVNKVPGLGDIPILGNLFKSKSVSKSNAELMVLVTAHRISPSAQSPAGPRYPQPFLDSGKFDASKAAGADKKKEK